MNNKETLNIIEVIKENNTDTIYHCLENNRYYKVNSSGEPIEWDEECLTWTKPYLMNSLKALIDGHFKKGYKVDREYLDFKEIINKAYETGCKIHYEEKDKIYSAYYFFDNVCHGSSYKDINAMELVNLVNKDWFVYEIVEE